jgi:glycerate dehydrogenase
MKAVFLDVESLDDLDLAPIRACVDELTCYRGTAPEQVSERIADCDLVLVNKVVLDAQALDSADALKLVCVVATGVNNVDLDSVRRNNIAVCNAQGYGVRSVAQHVMGLMLALHTHLLDYDRAVRDGDWGRATQFCLLDYPILELAGRKLGIVGYGALGQAVAELARAFGMEVLVSARPGTAEVPAGRVSFEALVESVDVLSLHCPLTETTRDLVDADVLARMRQGSFVINAARGGVVNEPALVDALRNGHLGGAATDVLTVEPPKSGNPLLAPDIPNLIVTPHCAWGSVEARRRIIDQTAENIRAFSNGESLRRVDQA